MCTYKYVVYIHIHTHTHVYICMYVRDYRTLLKSPDAERASPSPVKSLTLAPSTLRNFVSVWNSVNRMVLIESLVQETGRRREGKGRGRKEGELGGRGERERDRE